MAGESYLAVLKAAYDYEPQGEDEVAVKENALLFLLERTDDESVPPDRPPAPGLCAECSDPQLVEGQGQDRIPG
jgi:hypothetical protein